jgi:3-hydroxymyristoyl/3-hydroxydecanoyl-(acyl carrier protein) dehydratase
MKLMLHYIEVALSTHWISMTEWLAFKNGGIERSVVFLLDRITPPKNGCRHQETTDDEYFSDHYPIKAVMPGHSSSKPWQAGI